MHGNDISLWIAELKLWPLIVVLALNLLFRKYGAAATRKRMSSLYHAIAVFLIISMAGFVVARGLTDIYLYAGVAVVVVLFIIFRKRVFPYQLSCPLCHVRLDFKTIYFIDDNLCASCRDGEKVQKDVSDEDTA